jgi:hypothetical protein
MITAVNADQIGVHRAHLREKRPKKVVLAKADDDDHREHDRRNKEKPVFPCPRGRLFRDPGPISNNILIYSHCKNLRL